MEALSDVIILIIEAFFNLIKFVLSEVACHFVLIGLINDLTVGPNDKRLSLIYSFPIIE